MALWARLRAGGAPRRAKGTVIRDEICCWPGGGADTSRGAFMSRWGALPARGAIFSNRDSIFLSLLFDATCLMSVSCLFWHLLSVPTLLCPCGRLHDPGAPGIGRQVVGWQTKRWGGRFFRWGGACHPISIQSYAPGRGLTHSVSSVPITGKICFLTSYGLVILRVTRNYVNGDCRMAF